ncbi:MAG: arylesterase [Pseudomonadota bacterium]
MRWDAGRRWILISAAFFAQGCERAASPPAPPPAPTSSIDSANPQAAAPSPRGAVSDQPGEKFRLIMLGDSITAGFGLPAPEALPVKLQAAIDAKDCEIAIINAGVSGDTTADGLNRFGWSVDADANGVLIALGGNDLLQGIAPAQTGANLAAMIERAKERGLAVVLAGMRAPGNYGVQFQSQFDAVYPGLAGAYDVALYPYLLDGVGGVPKFNQTDGIHPNPEGIAKITQPLSTFLCTTIVLDR